MLSKVDMDFDHQRKPKGYGNIFRKNFQYKHWSSLLLFSELYPMAITVESNIDILGSV